MLLTGGSLCSDGPRSSGDTWAVARSSPRLKGRRVPAALAIACACLCLLWACGSTSSSDDTALAGGPPDIDQDAAPMVDLEEPLPDAGPLPYACEIGVMDGVDQSFAELAPGGVIPIGGTGQAGLTARMALRCTPGADQPALDSASVELTLTNPYTAVTAPRTPRAQGYDFVCGQDDVCEVVPILIEISHLAKLPQLEGLPVRVDLSVHAVDDPVALIGRDRSHGVFQRL